MTLTVIRLQSVGKTYPGAQGAVALSNVSFEIRQGDFISITGPSGSGKSSLLNVLGLLDQKDRGTYFVRDVSVDGLSPRTLDTLRSRTFGFVFQASHAIGGRTVGKNVELPLVITGVRRSKRFRLVRDALESVGILHKANDDAALLSGGERQRMAIARALVHSPDILLLDEPTGNLDSENTARVIALLHQLNSRGITIVVVTHDPILAAATSRQLVLRDGVVRETTAQAPDAREKALPEFDPDIPRNRRRPFARSLDAFSDALYGITEKPVRTALLMLVVMLGAGGLVAAQGISQSAANQISGLLTTAALDEIYATTSGGNRQFTDADVSTALHLDGVVLGGTATDLGNGDARVSRLGPLAQEGDRFTGFVSGSDTGALKAAGVIIDSSNALSLFNSPVAERVALLGSRAADQLGLTGSFTDGQVWISGHPFAVVGLITSADRNPRLLDSVVISNSAISSRLGLSKPSTLFLKTEPGMSHAVGAALPFALDSVNPDRVKLQATADIGSVRAGVNTQLNGLILVMALVLLGLAVLATAAVMASAVLTRHAEIGLRRAIGSSRTAVGRLFVIEGIILGSAGGFAGSAAGVVIALVACISQGWTPSLSLLSALSGIVVGMGVGAIATIAPAILATRVQPAVALRS